MNRAVADEVACVRCRETIDEGNMIDVAIDGGVISVCGCHHHVLELVRVVDGFTVTPGLSTHRNECPDCEACIRDGHSTTVRVQDSQIVLYACLTHVSTIRDALQQNTPNYKV